MSNEYRSHQYEFSVCVETPEGKRYEQRFVLPAFSYPVLRPYDLCLEDRIAAAVNGTVPSKALRIDTEREKLLSEIATQLAAELLDCIKKQDTKNGYPQ